MSKSQKITMREGGFQVAVIGDEDTITGFLLAGCGNISIKKEKNFLQVTNKTKVDEIEKAFKEFVSKENVSIILIAQNVASEIRPTLNDYNRLMPTVLEIPAKNTPYDPDKDSLLQRVIKLTGGD